MNHAKIKLAFGLLTASVTALFVSACTEPPTYPETTNYFVSFNPVYIDSLPGTTRALQVTGGYDNQGFAVLEVSQAEYDALPRLWAYQLWALSYSGSTITAKKSAPKFLWDPVRHVALQPDGSEINPRKFNFQGDVSTFQRLVLTIEPYPDYFRIEASGQDTARTVYIDTGVVNNDPVPALEFLSADLSSVGSTFPLRFATADHFDNDTGTFFLANFTGGATVPAAVTNSANYGIWFGQRVLGGDIVPSLTLPALPSGWVYEGWVIPPTPNPAFAISTGRFTVVDTRDQTDLYSGSFSDAFTLPVPGEDFLQNRPTAQWTFPMNMVSAVGDTGWAFVTIEPDFAYFATLDPQDPSRDIDRNPFFYRLMQSPLPDSAHTPVFDPNAPESNTFILQNMHGLSPKFGHPGAPYFEIGLGSE
jgi:hypothetical protein